MSIYPVKLSEWFSVGNEKFKDAYFIVKYLRCYACGKKVKWKSAIGHHSLPWGYGDLWCSKKCLNSGKKARVDKRRLKRLERREANYINILILEKVV